MIRPCVPTLFLSLVTQVLATFIGNAYSTLDFFVGRNLYLIAANTMAPSQRPAAHDLTCVPFKFTAEHEPVLDDTFTYPHYNPGWFTFIARRMHIYAVLPDEVKVKVADRKQYVHSHVGIIMAGQADKDEILDHIFFKYLSADQMNNMTDSEGRHVFVEYTPGKHRWLNSNEYPRSMCTIAFDYYSERAASRRRYRTAIYATHRVSGQQAFEMISFYNYEYFEKIDSAHYSVNNIFTVPECVLPD